MNEPAPTDNAAAMWTRSGLQRVLNVQRPVVLAHIRSLRRHRPEATPAEVAKTLETRYLLAVTGGGAASGAAAVVPGVGTVASIAISGVETAGFLEASALFAQSLAELHGVAVDDPERSSSLVMALMLGTAGSDLVKQFAEEASGKGQARGAYWADIVTKRIPNGVMRTLGDRLRKAFIKRFAAQQGAGIVFRAIPFGIGAVIGGAGNHILGRRIVAASREAFGPAPVAFPESVALVKSGSISAGIDQ